MKKSKYIILCCVVLFSLASCKKYLDVNTDPDNPNNSSVLIQNRLPWIEHFYQYTTGVSNFRTACVAGVYYSNAATGNTLSTTWTPNTGNTTPYQQWFVATASNLNDLYSSAQQQGAYQYMAAADVFHAMGFMLMLDIYGEMPYSQALSGNPSPGFDDGKAIYNGCMAKLNEAISLFGKTPDATAPSFALGDMWNGGDVNKWIKLCWGLKARYMVKLSKKADLYNADSILYCLSKGPQANTDNTIGPGFNNSTQADYLIGDPVVTNGNWDYAAQGTNQRISQFHYNLLTNMRGAGITDPRMTKIVPATMANIQLDASGKVAAFTWNRSIGVDTYNPQIASDPLSRSNRLVKGGATSIALESYAATNTNIIYAISDAIDRTNFIAAQTAAGRTFTTSGNNVTVTYKPGAMFINSTNYLLAGDTAYVNLKSSSLGFGLTGVNTATDLNWYPSVAAGAAGAIGSTGSFQVRPVSDQEILTYHEMNFIKAEVYMRKGDAGNAYTAYRAGIQAHLDMMQAKLTQWQAGGYNNPDMWPMTQATINTYLASSAVAQAAGTLTMSDIMLQKYVAMGCSIENWNDMRRFNFSAGNIGGFGVVYPGFDHGPLFAGGALYPGSAKTDPRYWPRRWPLPTTLEQNFNLTNVLALNPHATEQTIWSMPVWWDCATDAEYYGYLK
jgi:hypothetical protein